jgi:hypothetical protein
MRSRTPGVPLFQVISQMYLFVYVIRRVYLRKLTFYADLLNKVAGEYYKSLQVIDRGLFSHLIDI